MLETATVKKTWTYDTLVAEGLDPDLYEIVDGELVEVKTVGVEGARIFTTLAQILNEHVTQNGLGIVYTTARFLLREDPRRERRPDLAFVSTPRLPDPPDPFLFPGAPDLAFVSTPRLPDPPDPLLFPGAPDLVIEILSPSDPTGKAYDKASEFFEAGAREAWLVDSKLRTITVLKPDRPPRAYSIGDTLESPELPGFALSLERLFAPPPVRGKKPEARGRRKRS